MKRTLADAAAALGTILVASGAWLLVPRERPGAKPTLPALRVCLVDVSSSAIERRKEGAGLLERGVAAQADAAERAGEDFCTIRFGSEVKREFGPAPARTYARNRAEVPLRGEPATRLAGALEAASVLATDPERAGSTVVVLGDGTYTGADPLPILRELRDRGVSLERIDLPAADVAELAIGALHLPREVETGAAIAVDAEIFYAPGRGAPPKTSVSVVVDRRFASGHDSRSVDVPVPAGLSPDEDGYLRWRFRWDAGRAEAGLNVIRLRAGRIEEEGVVRGAGRLVVGVVTSQPLFEGSAPEGLDLEPLRPEELANRLDHLDAIVTCDLAPDRLPLEVLTSFVERGGGWLCLAGDRFLPGFVPGASALLPLAPPDEKPDPRDVVVLVDRSGSMAGEPFEEVRRAALSLLEVAPAHDAVELRFFGRHLSEAIPLKRAEDRRDTAQMLREAAERFRAGDGPGGSTAVAQSLEEFATERERSGRESLVFVLSDGVDTVDPGARERCAKVCVRLLAAKSRAIILAAGEEPDLVLLSKLVAPGEQMRRVGGPNSPFESLAEVFRREVSADRVRTGPRLRVLPAGAILDPNAAAGLGADVLRAQNPDAAPSWPAIQRYARAKSAPRAEVLWTSEKGEPLLAIQRVGLGATAACAFAPIPEWGSEWASRIDLWAPLLRALARGKREVSPTVRLEGDELTVEDLPVDAPADLEACFFEADAKPGDLPAAVLPLSPPTQGADPRRVRTGHWPGDADLARVEIRARGDSKWPAIELPFAPPRAPEFMLPRPRLDAGDLFAPRPGREPSATPQLPAVRSVRTHPAAPWVLFSGLLLLTLAGLGGFFARRAHAPAPG